MVVRRAVDQQEQPPLAEIAIDLRQAATPSFDDYLTNAVDALKGNRPSEGHAPFFLDTFKPWRDSIIWPFNRLFWQQLGDWEAYAKRGFEAALPSGGSDANHPEAVMEGVVEFWDLLHDLEKRGNLPHDIYAMEIGVGSGARARLWLDRFQAYDAEKGTGYYPRLKFLLGDYSPATLDTALAAVGPTRRSAASYRSTRPTRSRCSRSSGSRSCSST